LTFNIQKVIPKLSEQLQLIKLSQAFKPCKLVQNDQQSDPDDGDGDDL
jgi:hypothetical protein